MFMAGSAAFRRWAAIFGLLSRVNTPLWFMRFVGEMRGYGIVQVGLASAPRRKVPRGIGHQASPASLRPSEINPLEIKNANTTWVKINAGRGAVRPPRAGTDYASARSSPPDASRPSCRWRRAICASFSAVCAAWRGQPRFILPALPDPLVFRGIPSPALRVAHA